jgi:hypothetical protein
VVRGSEWPIVAGGVEPLQSTGQRVDRVGGDPADFGVVRQRVAASQMAADVDEIAEPLANFVFRVR